MKKELHINANPTKQKTLVLKMTGYMVKGTSDLTQWGGGNASIQMSPFKVDKIDKKTLLKNINDAGFGVESINGAICDIYEDYEGTLVFLKSVEVGKVSDSTNDVHNNIYE
jgi:hypothetical protein